MSVSDSHARKKFEIGKELLMVDETRDEPEERGDKKVGGAGGTSVRREKPGKGDIYSREQVRKETNREEGEGMAIFELRRNAGENQKGVPGDKDEILGEAKRKAMEMETMAKQEKEVR